MPSRPRSIRARVTIWAVLVVALVLSVGAIVGVILLRVSLTNAVDAAVRQDVDALGEQLEDGALNPVQLTELDDDERLIALHGASTVVNDDEALELPLPPAGKPTRAVIDGEPYLVFAEDVDAGLLVVARPLGHVDEAASTATVLLAVAVPLALGLIGLVVWVVATRSLAPVERLRREVDAIDESALDRRVSPIGGRELDGLAHTMNGMLARLHRAQLTQRQFVSDASHELRSPLATIRQHAELATMHPEQTSAAELADVVLDEGGRMGGLIDGLLLLARLDERRTPMTNRPVDLDDVALAEVSRIRGLGRVSVDSSHISPARVVGNEQLLSHAIRNLVDNAVRHAAESISIGVRERSGRALVWVDDDGPGIAPADRERVFDRFTRLDDARARDAGGSGLGLAIVRQVVQAHGGSVNVDDAALGGARFTIELPAAPDS